jgi:hypothetical protein
MFWLLFLTPIVAAQTPPQEAPKAGRIEGKVIHNATGAAIRRVTVTLRPVTGGASGGSINFGFGPPPGGSSATSDDEGKFVFASVEPGRYRLSAHRPGFLRLEYGSKRPGSPGTAIDLASGQEIKNLDFKLIPQGVIEGKVVDEEGEPMYRVFVNVMRYRFYRGRRQLQGMQGQPTNDRGEFRIAELPPGQYYVSANFGGPPPEARIPGDSKPEEAYVQTFFPGVLEQSAATPIEVGPGAEITGLSFPMRKSPVFRIRGKAAGLPSGNERVQITLRSRDLNQGMFFGGGVSRKPDGTFEIANVRPGSYYVAAMAMDRMGMTTLGRASVDVTNADVNDVLLTAMPALQMRGSVRVEGGQAVTYGNMQVMLMPADGFGGPPGRVKEDGTFVFESVSRDKYRIWAFGLPDGSYLKSVRAGGQDITQSGLDLSAAETGPELEVILSMKPAAVEGAVDREKPETPPGIVMLVPDPFHEELPAVPPLRMPQSVDQNGRFTIKSVPPGNYRIYAFEDFDMQEGIDPEMLKRLESKSERISVGEGETARATPKQITPADMQAR